MTFDEWWQENEKWYSSDALHMSEYHMASVIWGAATAAAQVELVEAIRIATLREREACAKVCEAQILLTKTQVEARSQAQANATAHDCANAIRMR